MRYNKTTMQHIGGLGDHLRRGARFLIYTMGFLMPLFFLPWTLDPLDINKQTLFVLLTLLAALLWIGSMMVDRAITVRRGWVNALPLLLVAAFGIPAYYSLSPYLSWVGQSSQAYTSALTMITGALLFFVMSNLFASRSSHKLMHTVLLFSATLTAVIGVCSLLGWNMFPGSLGEILAFNTVGTLNSLAIFLSVMSIFALATWLAHKPNDSLLHEGLLGLLERIATPVLAILTFIALLALDYSVTWGIFSAGLLVLLTFVVFRSGAFTSRKRVWVPGAFLIASLLFWFLLPSPFTTQVPLEVSLNHTSSLDIASNALGLYSSSYGSGPGTYLFDYAQFHGQQINETSFWAARFDRGSSFALTLLPTIGFVGVTAFASFLLLLLFRGLRQVFVPTSRDEWLESFIHLTPWLTLIIAGFIYPYNFTLTFSLLLFSGLIGSQMMGRISSRSFANAPKLSLAFSAAFTTGSLVFLIGIFMISQMYAAEAAFARAAHLDRGDGQLQEIVDELDRAAVLNRFNDTYYRNLSEALLLRVAEQLNGVSGVDALTPESQQYIQSLIAATVNASVHATDLSPYNVQNWLVRGAVYRELAPIQHSVVPFALEAYARAVELEPLNPAYWTEYGLAYLIAAQAAQPLAVATDQEIASKAQADVQVYLSNAESVFARAIELKPDYSKAHFQLGVTYKRQGRLDDAITKLESVAEYNALDVGVHFQLGLLYLERLGAEDIESAEQVLGRTVELAPSYSNARWFLATVYEAQDDLSSAIGQVEAVLALNPGNSLVETRLDRLLRGEVSGEVPDAIEE